MQVKRELDMTAATVKSRYTGLIAAVFTPMEQNRTLSLKMAPQIVEHLIGDGIRGLYVCGTTGEGLLLSIAERRAVAQAYVAAAGGRIPVIVQVGHNSLTEARGLAVHAGEIGADAIAAVPPMYFRPESTKVLIQCLRDITSVVPGLPFFYYHIPSFTGMQIDVLDLLRRAEQELPSLTGIKYSAMTMNEFQACLDFAQGRYAILFGCDDMLLSSLSVGASGAVGSTYNFAAPLYNALIDAFGQGDLEEARRLQGLSLRMIRLLYRYRGQPAFKATMGLLGVDCGPNRLPIETLSADEIQAMKRDLEEIGFFDWARGEGQAK
ncbi:MAG: dihydrodipicolinate synthase family protein [Planctomycetota bacterium]|nr:dihydrodipicolinate synthase family protein [Planctomycetota bacterium]